MSGGAEKKKTATNTVQAVQPGTFESEHHFYQKALNAQIHPLVSFFLSMDNETMIRRYCHLHPGSSAEELRRLLSSKPNHFQWSGADLFNVTTAGGDRHMVVIETNSCPSGQKSMPLADPCEARGGYWRLANKTFKPMLEEKQREGKLVEGALAVLFDKNKMECTGYAAALADAFQETVYLVEWFHEDEDDSTVRLNAEGVIEIADPSNPSVFIPLRAAFRYMTQKPWSRFPLNLCKTVLLNPIIACLAGGRNKALASKAYEVLNEELAERSAGISIKAPLTIRDVKKERLAEMVKDFGGHAVVKVPYSNAGQGVYTITNDEEMRELLEDIDVAGGSYDNFIVQSLIGNFSWTSDTREGKFFHVGSMPDKKGGIYVSDLRMLIHFDYSVGAFRPIGGYARRARDPLVDKLEPHMDSWSMLGTNLSVKKGTNSWDTETSRLLLLDQKDFNSLGVSVDDLIDAFFQATLSTLAIDHMASRLIAPSSSSSPLPFNLDLFSSLNHDPSLINEIRITQ